MGFMKAKFENFKHVYSYREIKCAKVCAVIFLLMGSGVTYLGMSAIWEGIESNGWDTVEGEVLVSNIEVNSEGMLSPVIEYSYHVEGFTYQGDRVNIVNVSTNIDSLAKIIVDRYRVGDRPKIYYDAAEPSRSVLEPGFHWGMLLYILIGGGCLMVFWLLVSLVRYGRIEGN